MGGLLENPVLAKQERDMTKTTTLWGTFAATALVLGGLSGCSDKPETQKDNPAINLSQAPDGPYDLVFNVGYSTTYLFQDRPTLQSCFATALTLTRVQNTTGSNVCVSRNSPNYAIKFDCIAGTKVYGNGQGCVLRDVVVIAEPNFSVK